MIMEKGLLLVFRKCPWFFSRKRRGGQTCQFRVFLLYKYTNVCILGLWRAALCWPSPCSLASTTRESMCLLPTQPLASPGAHVLCEHVPAGKPIASTACGIGRFFCPAIRVQHERVFAFCQFSRQHRPVRTSCASMCLLANQLPAPRTGLTDFTIPPFGYRKERYGTAGSKKSQSQL